MLLSVLIIFYSILNSAGIMVIIILMSNAPLGWEDKNGFHLGNKNPSNLSEKQSSRKNFLRYYYMPITGNKANIF